jgi:hypothetical protein
VLQSNGTRGERQSASTGAIGLGRDVAGAGGGGGIEARENENRSSRIFGEILEPACKLALLT